VRLPEFELQQPRSLEEAQACVAQAAETSFDFLGGGTDLLCNYKWRLNVPEQVISLKHLPELQQAQGGALAAGRTLAEIEACAELAKRCPELPRAASQIATPLIRRTATLGGNLHLDTRCWHFNQTAEWRAAHDSCLKAEADQCRVQPVPGDVCVATYSGDLAPVLLAYGAEAILAGPDGERRVDLAEYFALDGIRRFQSKQAAEFMLRVELAADASDWTVRYQKLRLRDTFDFPEGGVAVALQFESGEPTRIRAARVATTAYDSIPRLYPQLAEALVGGMLNEELAEEIGTSLQKQVQPMKNTSMAPAYRKKMARVLCKRALLACLPGA